ncbi:MAG: hypothetical protein Q9217_002780 [Psora testacea]
MALTTLTPNPGLSLNEESFATSILFRSRSRRQQYTDDEVEPLLSNLSPASTLEALVATSAVHTTRDRSLSFVEASVANASDSERAWGIKAALAGKKIIEWHDELQGWSWSDSKENAKNNFHDTRDGPLLQQYQNRIKVIRDDMDTLEVEELKRYVREAHVKTSISETHTSKHDHLDDFTAIITATIVQSLPTLSRLNFLLVVWSTRLIIIRQLPAFLTEMKHCQESMLSAWMGIGQTDKSNMQPNPNFSRKASSEVKAVLQDQIRQLGKRVDGMLDLLEGSQDTLPEEYIDGMDKLEDEYISWVVQAEELVLYNEMEAVIRAQRAIEQGNSFPGKNLSALGEGPHTAEETYVERDASNANRAADRLPTTSLAHGLSYSNDPATESSQDEAIVHEDAASSFQVADTSLTPKPQQALNTPETNAIKRMWTKKPSPLSLGNPSEELKSRASACSEVESDLLQSSPATSDYSSNGLSPEIMSASAVTYLGTPAKVSKPAQSNQGSRTQTISRPSSQPIERNPELGKGRRERSMTSASGAPITQGSPTVASELQVPDLNLGPARLRSASLQSFKKVRTGKVRKLLVPRSGSYSSTPLDGSPEKSQDSSVDLVDPSSQPKPDPLPNGATTPASCPRERSGAKRCQQDIRPSAAIIQQAIDGSSPIARRHSRLGKATDYAAGSAPISVRKQKPAQPSSKTTPQRDPSQAVAKHNGKLEARISSLLTSIPADIRLASSAAATPPPSTRPRNISNPQTPLRRSITPKLFRSVTPTSSPSLTLTPAPSTGPKPSVTNTANEPEIKLYHLHHSGKDSAPVKLYVRLVGEAGERVMVRVGGGWADLGEYLREYASHHGMRSVSDARCDVQDIANSSPQGMSSPSRPQTPASELKVGSGCRIARMSEPVLPQTPTSLSRPSSRGSCGDGDQESPSLGLSGPKPKKVDISPSKQAWVDDVLEQARQGSGEKRKRGALGFLGRVGSSNRVFLKTGGDNSRG